MKLAQLFSIFGRLKWGSDPDREVIKICRSSNEVTAGSVFVAIRGQTFDGHQFVAQACARGAIGVVVEDESVVPTDYAGAVVKVPDTRAALDDLAARFFAYPARELFCVGVTGTNGKTTVTYMVEKILTEFGWPTGLMGTIQHRLGSHLWPSDMTTPDPLVFNQRLRQFADQGARALALEVSSHALQQRRVHSVPFDVAVFTNLTRDHLDYHRDMEDYFAAKEKLFIDILQGSEKSAKFAIINSDDPWGRRLSLSERIRTWTYGEKSADLQFKILSQDYSGTRLWLSTPLGRGEWVLPVPGVHNVYNAVAAIGVGLAAGSSYESCVAALSRFQGVPGRLESVGNPNGIHVFVDYAHTDDALKNVLTALRGIREQMGSSPRLTVVFGCGGDRDRGKRPLMGQVAGQLADQVIVTSDNPRSEDPELIIRDILAGIKESLPSAVVSEVDRRKAIHRALNEARPGDVVLIAGKGHEDYQIIGSEKKPFQDQQVVREFFNAK